MKMYEVEVSITDGNIYITQQDNTRDEPMSVVITSDQADMVAEWIKDAAASLRKSENIRPL
ncbi:hypothetical protein LMG26846_05266 [Achromobacter insuavis]|uniref:hypothetical protein n=1 Tax=Achromobacter insuavis TaxID=1287735 RepID=UPI0014675A06|nr:hypothetical protein [Achromobacter insuavis]CAB3915702.1 hypothetical protein LMG26846_05266 [Achromobacter insuavis]